MGIEEKNQICVMIHSGSRGFGHQVATGTRQVLFQHFFATLFFFLMDVFIL